MTRGLIGGIILGATLLACAPREGYWRAEDLTPPEPYKDCLDLREKALRWDLVGDSPKPKCTTLTYNKESRPVSGGPDYIQIRPSSLIVCQGGVDKTRLGDIVIAMKRRGCVR